MCCFSVEWFYLPIHTMYTKEQKILRFSMILFFLALMIVYLIWYQVQGSTIKDTLSTVHTSTGISVVSKTGEEQTTITSVIDTQYTGYVNTGANKPMIPYTETTWTQKYTTWMTKDSTITMLSGTSIYYGKIEIIEKLGIKYQYALTDAQGIRYIYLGTPSYDFASIARALKGTIYTMATEQELLQNKLFGNKVVFINLPEYKDKKVVMLIYQNDGIWLIQVDYANYHKSKAYIQSLFTD